MDAHIYPVSLAHRHNRLQEIDQICPQIILCDPVVERKQRAEMLQRSSIPFRNIAADKALGLDNYSIDERMNIFLSHCPFQLGEFRQHIIRVIPGGIFPP